MRSVSDIAIGLVLLGIGGLALVQWNVVFGFVLLALGMEQSGLAQSLIERRRKNAQAY